LIGYLGCMFVLLIGPTGFGCAITISCVKGAVLVDWVQGCRGYVVSERRVGPRGPASIVLSRVTKILVPERFASPGVI
jgi:hypothetical protein